MPYCAPSIPAGIPTVIKASSATLNYGFDLSPPAQQSTLVVPWAPPIPFQQPWLQPGEQVLSLTVTSDGGTPTGSPNVTIVNTQIAVNSTGVPASLIQAWISGGTPGVTYGIQFVFTTNSTPVGRIDERTIALVVVSER
jgi:hypothetical protein